MREGRWLSGLLVLLTLAAAAPPHRRSAPKPSAPATKAAATVATAAPAELVPDPAHPAATLTALVDHAASLAELAVAAPRLEAAAATERNPADAARAWLAAATAHLLTDTPAGVRRCAAAARVQAARAGKPDLEGYAALLTWLDRWSPPREAQLDEALARYTRSGNVEGQQLARAFAARRAADVLVDSASVSNAVLARVQAWLTQLEAGPAVPLADLHGAWAAEQAAEQLTDDDAGADAGPWFARAERLAARAGERAPQGSLIRLGAANLTMQAELWPAVWHHSPPAPFRTAFLKYDAALVDALTRTADPGALLEGGLGQLANQALYTGLLHTGDPSAAPLAAKRLVRLAQVTMPLAERPPAGRAVVDLLLGKPGRQGVQEYGLQGCRLLTRTMGDLPPDEDPAIGSYLEFGFWFYERMKAAALARMLARLTGEAKLSPADREQHRLLEGQWRNLVVSLYHTALQRDTQVRAAARSGQPSVPWRDPGLGDLFGRYRALRAALTVLELGNDADAKVTAEVLSRRLASTEVQQLLPDGRSAVLACGYDWAFVISPRGVHWRFLEPPRPLTRVVQLAGRIGDVRQPLSERLGAARSLYDTYVRPLLPDLQGVDKLLVVPDGPVACLPFEALVSGTREQDAALPRDWPQAAFLGDRFAIDYLPSLTMAAIVHQRCQGLDRQAPKELLAVGDVRLADNLQVPEDDQRFVLVPIRGGEDALSPLPFAGLEAQTVAREVGVSRCTVLTGDAATESAVLQELPRHKMLHFATHGVLASDGDPLGAGLLLSPDAKGQAGVLTAREVYGMKLPARLAVLSACDTARGQVRFVSGGVTSLAGAFLYAGVPDVVASLWPVDDQATAAFMQRFYATRLSTEHQAMDALQQAKTWLRTEQQGRWADPYYWAPFLLFR